VRSFGALVLVPLFITACSSSVTADSGAWSTVAAPVPESQSANAEVVTEVVRENIPVPLSLYVLTDADDPASALSSKRSIDDVETIAARVQEIW